MTSTITPKPSEGQRFASWPLRQQRHPAKTFDRVTIPKEPHADLTLKECAQLDQSTPHPIVGSRVVCNRPQPHDATPVPGLGPLWKEGCLLHVAKHQQVQGHKAKANEHHHDGGT
eukprot:1323534-Amphidinium_carterae.1